MKKYLITNNIGKESACSIWARRVLRAFGNGASVIVLLALVASVYGCSTDEAFVPTGQGKVNLTVKIDDRLHTAEGGVMTVTNPIDVNQLSMTMFTSDGTYSHTWRSIAEFDTNQSFPAGEYCIMVFYYSPDYYSPSYRCIEEFVIKADETTDLTLTASIINALVKVSAENVSADVIPQGVWVRDGSEMMNYVALDDSRYIYSGTATLYPVVSNADGTKKYTLDMSAITNLDAATYSTYTIAGDDNTFAIKGTGIEKSIATGADFWTAASPIVKSDDITAGSVLTIYEGVPLEKPMIITATSERPMRSLILSVNSSIVCSSTDILANEPDVVLSEMMRYGFKVSVSDDRRSVMMDFTRVLEQTPTLNAVYSQLSIMAIDDRGVCSEPFIFDVDSESVELSLKSATPAVVGVNSTTIELLTSTTSVEESDFKVCTDTGDGEKECVLTDWSVDATSGTISFTTQVPEGVQQVPLTVYYLGTPRVSTNIARAVPQCTMTIDTYATTMYVTFASELGEDVAAAVARYATFDASGTKLSVWERYPDKHSVAVSGLIPGTQYNVSARLMNNAEVASTYVTTEKAEDLPQGTFEDVKTIYEVKHLACGGKYSTSDIPVVSRQNFTDIKIVWPEKYWAGVNAKTFSDACTNANTWYKMPSGNIVETLSNDSRVICLTSVGWDINGEDIPDYIQQKGQYIPYNNNVPKVSHRSAGKLFLGKYEFDPKTMEERYEEGIPFHSRPSALNGFYKYLPDATTYDSGLIRVIIYGKDSSGAEIEIGRGESQMHIAADMTAFSIPIHYTISSVKATRLSLMASSSTQTGDIEYEDKHVPVTSYPEKGAYIGSSLWLNALHVSY